MTLSIEERMSALGKRTVEKLGREHMSAIGKLGGKIGGKRKGPRKPRKPTLCRHCSTPCASARAAWVHCAGRVRRRYSPLPED